MDIDAIISAMNLTSDDAIQRVQTAHRLNLIRYWGIRPGSRVLEIGCGQGDTLAALAHAVGPNGFVHGVDLAGPDYGAPETLGQARDRLLSGAYAERMRIDLSFNVMDDAVDFGANAFDYIVLSHCLWYLSGYDELVALLRRVSRWGKRLCIAEWDPRLRDPGQLPHLQAVTIQAVCQSYYPDAHLNVRTLIYPQEIDFAILEGGWSLEHSESLPADELQDGAWEVRAAQELCPRLIGCSDMPENLKRLLFAQLSELDCCCSVSSLPVYCAKASRYTPKHFHNS